MTVDTFKWSDPEQVLWVRMKVAAPESLDAAGATGQYAYALQNLSLKVRKIYVTAIHTVDPQSVLRFDNQTRTKTVNGLQVPQSKVPKRFYETLSRSNDPMVSDTSTVTTITTHGTTPTSILYDGPIGSSDCSTP